MKQTWKIDYDTQYLIREQYKQGVSKNQLAKKYNVTWSTIDNIINKAENGQLIRTSKMNLDWVLNNVPDVYCELLGWYLGDGYVAKANQKYGVFRLTICLDNAYPKLIECCVDVVQTVNHCCKVFLTKGSGNCTYVNSYSKQWLNLIPQANNITKGMKCTHNVSLVDWQHDLVLQYPREFLRGLFWTDGCRYTNTVNVKGKQYQYPSYSFVNTSKDIVDILTEVLDNIGVEYKTLWRSPTGLGKHHVCQVRIGKRHDVELLDQFIGSKQ